MEARVMKKNPLKSKTTQTVAGSVGVVGGLCWAVLRFVRDVYPDTLPWSPDMDAAIVAAVTTAVAPLVSRAVAWLRGKI